MESSVFCISSRCSFSQLFFPAGVKHRRRSGTRRRKDHICAGKHTNLTFKCKCFIPLCFLCPGASGFPQEHPGGEREADSYTEEVGIIAPQNANLVSAAQVLHPWNVPILQAFFFGTAEVFWAFVAFFDVQQAVVRCCRQLEVQTLRVEGQVLLRAALGGGSLLVPPCRGLTRLLLCTALLLNLLAVTSSRLLSFLRACGRIGLLAVTRLCVLVPEPGRLQDRLVGGGCDGAAAPGQSAVAWFFRRSETWSLTGSWIIAPVKLRKTGFPGSGGRQRTSFQGAVTEILKKKKQTQPLNLKRCLRQRLFAACRLFTDAGLSQKTLFLDAAAAAPSSHSGSLGWTKGQKITISAWRNLKQQISDQAAPSPTVCISLKKMFCKLDMDENTEE